MTHFDYPTVYSLSVIGNLKMRKLFIIFLLLTPLLTLAQEEEQCIFDQSTQTDEFIRSVPEFSNYNWNKETKQATITLTNGETLIAHRGGCIHFGISGTLISNDTTEFNNLDYWFNKSLWIAERLFSESDFQIVKKSIQNKTYSMPDGTTSYILFPHKSYSEFAMTLKKNNGKIELYIGYYFN